MARAIAAASAAEIAFIAGLTDREINRLVDEDVLRAPLVHRLDGRRFAPLTASFATFWFSASDNLTRTARINVIEVLTRRLLDRPDVDVILTLGASALKDFDWSVHFDALTVELTQYVEMASRRAGRVSEAGQHITEDPQVLGGAPCFARTRVPVANVLAASHQGMSFDELQAAWPFLTPQLLEDADVYMKAHPRPGRPRRFDELLSPHTRVSRKVVRRAPGAA
ncbi:DUF433 domain-containing protein [Burkholderia contaminans]|uniref:DUF433 domain-containing protein n=1 Tax=Burkholderia contaminans TaxID=488447 RepID=UPI00158F217E|nr:DUF433 domain-containing protein [Burkholderia contaminans]